MIKIPNSAYILVVTDGVHVPSVHPIGGRQAVIEKMREIASKNRGTLETTVYGARITTNEGVIQLTVITTLR